jgi:hypothetical protein
MGCIVKMTSFLESFDSSNVHANFLDWALQLMYVHDQLMIIISSSSMEAYGCWTIKALVEAEVLYDGFTVSHGYIAAPLIIARPLGVSLLINNYKTSIKPI